MYNTKNAFVLDALNQNDPYLQHYGIMGMHWGVRRYQPYGEGGYDPDHKGRNVGLAARLAGGGTSYSNLYGRGAKKHSVLGANGGINVGPSNAARKIGRGVNEALERMNYANDRLGSALKTAGAKSRQGLVNYVSYLTPTSKAPDPMLQRMYQKDITDNKGLAKAVAKQFKENAGHRVSQLKQTSMADVQKMLGNGASAFKDTMAKTKVNAKNFGRNAAMTAALLGGAFDPTSSATQIMGGRSKAGVKNRSTGATVTTKNPIEGLKHPTLRRLDERYDPTDVKTGNAYYMSEGKVFKPKSREYATSIDASRAYDGGYLGGSHRTYDRQTSSINERDVSNARKTLLSSLDNPSKPNTADVIKSREILDKAIADHKPLGQTLDALHKKYTLDPYQYGYLVTGLSNARMTEIQNARTSNNSGGTSGGMWVSSTDLGRRLLGL